MELSGTLHISVNCKYQKCFGGIKRYYDYLTPANPQNAAVASNAVTPISHFGGLNLIYNIHIFQL